MGIGNQSSADARIYRPCPECKRGHSLWEDNCEMCGNCGREFDASGLILTAARCEGDIDGWGSLS